MIILFIYSKTSEYQYHNKDIVNGKRLFHKVTGQVFHSHILPENPEIPGVTESLVVAVRGAVRKIGVIIGLQRFRICDSVYPLAVKKKQSVKKKCNGNPDCSPDSGLLHSYHMVFFMKNSDVERQQHDNQDEKAQKKRQFISIHKHSLC